MPRILLLYVLLFISILVFSVKCFSSQHQLIPRLKFGYSEFAPYTYTTDKRQAVGEITDILRKVVVGSGYAFETIPGSNRRLLRSILTANLDLLMVVPFKSADSDKLIFGEKAFDKLDMAVFWLAGKTPAINNISQLQSKALIAIAGYSYGGIFLENGALMNTERILLETHPRALQALFLERAPYLLDYKKPAMFYIEPERKVQLASYTFSSIPLVLSIRRNYPNAEQVLKELETHFSELFPERFQALNPELTPN